MCKGTDMIDGSKQNVVAISEKRGWYASVVNAVS